MAKRLKKGDLVKMSKENFQDRETGKPCKGYWTVKVSVVSDTGYDLMHLNGRSAGYYPFSAAHELKLVKSKKKRG